MIAELGLRIRSDGTREAITDLNRLSTTAGLAEQKVTAAARDMSRGVTTMGRGFGNLGPAVQQASFQIQDFAVQVGSGTSATRAFAQQFPQLVGGFGAWGAAIGAAVAVGAGLAPMLLKTRDAAKELDSVMEGLADAFEAFREATEAANAPLEDLVERYGRFNERGRELLRVKQELGRMDLQGEIESVAATFRDMFSGLSNPQAAIAAMQNMDELIAKRDELQAAFDRETDFRARIDMSREIIEVDDAIRAASRLSFELRDVARDYGITAAQAADLATAANAAANATTDLERASALEGMRAALLEAVGGWQNLEGKSREAYDAISDAVEKALQLAAIDIASGIGAGADEAARLAENLGAAAQAGSVAAAFAKSVGRANPGAPVGGGLGFGGVGGADTGVMSGNFAPFVPEPPKLNVSAFQPVKLASGGGRGGGGASKEAAEAQKEHNDRVREAERIIADTRTELENYNAELADLAELNKLGYFKEAPEAYARAVATLNEELANSQHEQLRQGIESISDSIADAIVNGENLGEAFRNILAQMAQDILSSGINQLLTDMLTPKGGAVGGGGILGAILGAFGGGGKASGTAGVGVWHQGGVIGETPPGMRSVSAAIFANAERYHSGGIAGLRENEVPAILERGERVLPKGASDNITITVVGEEGATFLPRVKNISRGEAAPMVAKTAQAQHRSYGSRARSYQLRGTT